MEMELDLSWTEEYNRTLNSGVTYCAEPMSQLHVQFLYTNSQNEMCHSLFETVPLRNSTLSEADLMQLIFSHREYQNTRYKCDDIVQYYISIDPHKLIQEVANEDFTLESSEQVHTFQIPKDVVFPNTLFIFHSVNTLWIHFRELTLVNDTKCPPSILKSNDRPKTHKHTKRVRIANQRDYKKCNTTRKQLSERS
mgnify:FL=1